MDKQRYIAIRAHYRATRRTHRMCGRAPNEAHASAILQGLDPRLARCVENAPSYYPADRIERLIESAQSEVRRLLGYLGAKPIRRTGFSLRLTCSYNGEPRVVRLRDLRVLLAEVCDLVYGPKRGTTTRTPSTGDWKRDAELLSLDLEALRAMRAAPTRSAA